jgi:hypothetical protein
MTRTEARDVRRAMLLGLDVMQKQLADGSAEFKAMSYVNAERAAAELAECIDRLPATA